MTITSMIDATIAFVRAHQGLAPAIVFLLGFLESLAFLSLLVPSTAILIAISGLFGAGGLAFEPLVIAGGLGASLGYAISYWLGLYFHEPLLRRPPFSTHPEMVARGERFFARYGLFGVFLGHFFGPVRAIIPVLAGIARMPALPFQLANVPSGFLWAFFVMAPGYFATASGEMAPFWRWLRALLP